jgi:curved DNA-binding protein CbpA
MSLIHTHYENLRVARNAPQEVIRAAYRVLAQQHHPDRNASDPESVRIMQQLNDAYRVLSNPNLRREHDAWIDRQEKASTGIHQSHSSSGNINPEKHGSGPFSSEQDDDSLRYGNTKKQVSELDLMYERFIRKFPYYLLNVAALGALFLIFWTIGQ